MATEMTPQERAAVTRLYEKILSYSPDKEAMEAGDDKDFEAIRQALVETRRAAMLEAAQVVREFVQHYPTDIFIEPLPGQHGRTVDACSASAIRAICPTIANAIDRLAQEG